MSDIKPSDTVNKILISTPSRFVGIYENDGLLITHAWPAFDDALPSHWRYPENPYGRSYYVVAFTVPPIDETETIIMPDYHFLGEHICAYLSILFGKRFDNHGFLQALGMFRAPQIESSLTPCAPDLKFTDHLPRKDLGIELNLVKLDLIEELFFDDSLESRFRKFLHTAGKFYLQALQIFEKEPEIAFLNLITCGEILSNYYKYPTKELLDDEMTQVLETIEADLPDGEKVANQVASRLYQVRQGYTRTIVSLLNDYFFTNTESSYSFAALKKADIERRIKASYDLRSRYVHTGIDFGSRITLFREETQLGTPVVESKDFQTILKRSPTFFGMERIIRYCLLRFIHTESKVFVDERLED